MKKQKKQYFWTLVKEIHEIIVFFGLLKVLFVFHPKTKKHQGFFGLLVSGGWEPPPESPESLLQAPLGIHNAPKVAPKVPKVTPRRLPK